MNNTQPYHVQMKRMNWTGAPRLIFSDATKSTFGTYCEYENATNITLNTRPQLKYSNEMFNQQKFTRPVN